MIERLSIINYALIDSLEINFEEGLSIVTGETGAGKSVMLGAIGLVLGGRTDSKVLEGRTGKAVVEASFSNVSPELEHVFDRHDLDWNDGNVIVRREISANGRSRAFVNDTPVTLPVLDEIAGQLVDVHSQHSNRLLSMPAHQLWIIDSMADSGKLLSAYRKNFRRFAELRTKIKRIKETAAKNRENREFIAFQLEQLDKLNPKRGELAEIERSFDLLSEADEMRSNLSEAYGLIQGLERSALTLIAEAGERLQSINMQLIEGPVEIEDDSIINRLHATYVELKDIAETIEGYASGVESDPSKLAKVSNRMQELYEARKRFRVAEDDGLVNLREELRYQLKSIVEGDTDVAELEKEGKELASILRKQADEISALREKAAARFSEELTREARPLGLKNLNFEVRNTRGKMGIDGQDNIEFYCAFNKNQNPQPLNKVASGGEMSRLTLCIKAMVAGRMKLPTVIFDEIDTGVSGEIADKMGSMMARIAGDMQVIAITHLPQVAAKGRNHYLVFKTDLKDRTVSNVRQLSFEDRVRELARMLSGKQINPEAMANALTLLTPNN
ncbi:MAG: DNA repair protein RecN [Bacteroides sp.]|nr:DNA repair protein RecN [Bacteroides sp.]